MKWLGRLIAKLLPAKIQQHLLFRNKIDDKIYFTFINPKKVSYYGCIPETSPLLRGSDPNFGTVNGNWDLLKTDIEKTTVNKIAKYVLSEINFMLKIQWQWVEISRSKYVINKEKNKIKKLSNKLLQSGYKSQYELDNLNKFIRIGKRKIPKNELILAVDRKGTLIRLIGGAHRLAVAKQINLEKIPAIVTLIHPDGLNKLNIQLISIDEGQTNESIYSRENFK